MVEKWLGRWCVAYIVARPPQSESLGANSGSTFGGMGQQSNVNISGRKAELWGPPDEIVSIFSFPAFCQKSIRGIL